MVEEIFRKKSLDKIKSPESLDDYIRVSNPGVWLLLISVVILLAGVCVWSLFGHIDSTVSSTVRVQNAEAVCYVSEENISSIQTGLTVKFANTEASITQISEKTEEGYVCKLSSGNSLADGFYEAKVVIRSYRPLSFIFN